MTSSLLTIKIITRDNPKGLKLCLESVYDDIIKNDLDFAVALVDDSRSLENLRRNKDMFLRIFGNSSFDLYYLSQEEYAKALAKTTPKIKQTVLSLVGMLGSEKYQPSRAKNASQCVDIDSSYDLLVDDDIIIGFEKESKSSVIRESLAKAKTHDSYVSVHLKGFPDVSIVQLLERSIIEDKDKLHSWNEDNSIYNLSGGFLLYPRDKTLPIFPSLYNEDFLWVAYGAARSNKKTTKLSLNVLHTPTSAKHFCADRLAYEATGEISYATLNGNAIKDLVERQVLPEQKQIELAINEYREYIEYAIHLIRGHYQSSLLNSDYLGSVDLKECERTLVKHLEDAGRISYQTIQGLFQNWMKQQSEWARVSLAFSSYLKQEITLSYP